ncbi:MAG: precorrin-6Y C5,15-methyltransferase (decarboxylating) subunit CbiT [Candidatus Bathyarchaeia archaeon]|jgi:cobalt-precorrin-6B (C15)-methyltransferase
MGKRWTYKTPGIPDELFNQNDEVPGPTKEEIRVITLSKARLSEGSIVIDVGCGSGGLTVEAALQVAPKGKVFAIDEDQAAIDLTMSNVEKFEVHDNVKIVHGKAPEAFLGLPHADAVIIGGSGALNEVLRACVGKLNPNGRVVINSILLETACTALNELKSLGFKDIDVCHISVAKGKQINSGTMMMARNPITVVSATKP